MCQEFSLVDYFPHSFKVAIGTCKTFHVILSQHHCVLQQQGHRLYNSETSFYIVFTTLTLISEPRNQFILYYDQTNQYILTAFCYSGVPLNLAFKDKTRPEWYYRSWHQKKYGVGAFSWNFSFNTVFCFFHFCFVLGVVMTKKITRQQT